MKLEELKDVVAKQPVEYSIKVNKGVVVLTTLLGERTYTLNSLGIDLQKEKSKTEFEEMLKKHLYSLTH